MRIVFMGNEKRHVLRSSIGLCEFYEIMCNSAKTEHEHFDNGTAENVI